MTKLELTNFKAFLTNSDSITIDFTNENKNLLLYGDNGAGKSSIYEAIKLAFYFDRLIPNLSIKLQEEQRALADELLQKYTNSSSPDICTLKINEENFRTFNKSDYSVYLLTLDELSVDPTIRLDILVKQLYIKDYQLFCQNNYEQIATNINRVLKDDFKEDIQIDIDAEDDYKIRIKNDKKNIEYKKEDIKNYFNEARLNLVVLLCIFESLKLIEKNSKNILVLDDFITSLDVSNRTFIIKYIFDNFKDFQILIFTHNVFFYNLIQYMISEYYKFNERLQKEDWKFANIYEIQNHHTLYIKGSNKSAKELQDEFKVNNRQDVGEFGNKVRQRFEVLLYELSKLLIVGAVEESKDIIHKIEVGNSIYLNDKILVKLEKILHNQNIPENKLREKLLKTINSCKQYGFKEFQDVVRELKLYQKVTLHPMSHGKIGQSSYTTTELSQSLDLLVKLEANIEKMVKKYHTNLDGV